MFFRGLRHVAKTRHRAQGLVEYGAIAATVAFVGIAALNALTLAQRNYFNDLPMNPTAPSAPGALLHPTRIDAPICTPAVVALGATITCNAPVIHDVYSNPNDLNPPQGTIGLHLDAEPTPRATCQLNPSVTNGGQNSCMGSLTWATPNDPALVNPSPNHTLSFWFECYPGVSPCPPAIEPKSNHLSSGSATLAFMFLHYEFNGVPQCGSGAVEVGSPITCTAAVYDTTTNVAPVTPVIVTWTAVPDPVNGTGTPFLSCATGGVSVNYASMIWNNPPTPSCAPGSTVSCTTNAAGVCSVIFRRVRALMGPSPLTSGYQDLTVSISTGRSVTSGTGSWPSHAVVITSPGAPHLTRTWSVCTIPPPAVAVQPAGTTIDPPSVVPFVFRDGTFQINADIGIHGPLHSGTLSCTATVIDQNPTPALDCTSSPYTCASNPDGENAHSPVGNVTWSLTDKDGVLIGSPTLGGCTLQRLDVLGGQPGNQTPYASWCTSTLPITLTGLTDNELDNLVAVQTASPTHIDSASSFSTHISFQP